MSICIGEPPYEIVCDTEGCNEYGPAAYSEDEAASLAEDEGWGLCCGEQLGDYCPTCWDKMGKPER